MTFAKDFFSESIEIINKINTDDVEHMVSVLKDLYEKEGRLFFLGVGGSAANCSHAVNDFRKIVGIESYSPVDNVSELTARTNDQGWENVFSEWLKVSKLNSNDAIFILSVGGGDATRNISPNLVKAIDYAKLQNSKILGIVGRDGGYTAKMADVCVVIPTVNNDHVTPHAEGFQGLVWHLIVSHPKLKKHQTTWESK